VHNVVVELINTGSELLLGRVLNTHLQWLGRQLADVGMPLRQVSVHDTAEAITGAVAEALARADLVITTGGLGPTCDDITRERIAALLGLELEYRPEAAAQVQNYFARLNRQPPAGTRVEAFAPKGALLFPNAHGTASGIAVRVEPGRGRPRGRRGW
jgi:nicotinamide-nucleotide amidase